MQLSLGNVKHSAQLRLDRSYMSESYDQARRYGSKWLLIERTIGSVFVIAGLAFFYYFRGEIVFPLAIVAIGVMEFFSGDIKKLIWLRRHSKSKLSNAEVAVLIDENGIESTGPFSKARMSWTGIERIVRTPKGILVWPQKGMYTYFPETALGRECIDFITSHVA